MARYTDSACRLCRRENVKLFLKGDRCLSQQCALTRNPQIPGQHGKTAGRKRTNEYGRQLREKQKAKRYYGILEKQFKNYFVKADKQEGQTGENLLVLIERRLDNVVYRMGMASSRKEARQLISHGHFRVNGKKVNIPSYITRVGEVIDVKEASRKSPKFEMLVQNITNATIPSWLELSVQDNDVKAKIVSLPKREDIGFEIEEHLIVELYSK